MTYILGSICCEQTRDLHCAYTQMKPFQMRASDAGHLETVKSLLSAGSDPNLQLHHLLDGWTAIMWASARGHSQVVRVLLENGAGASHCTCAREN